MRRSAVPNRFQSEKLIADVSLGAAVAGLYTLVAIALMVAFI